MAPNGQEELADESDRLLLLSQAEVPGHLGADGQGSRWIGHRITQDLCIL